MDPPGAQGGEQARQPLGDRRLGVGELARDRLPGPVEDAGQLVGGEHADPVRGLRGGAGGTDALVAAGRAAGGELGQPQVIASIAGDLAEAISEQGSGPDRPGPEVGPSAVWPPDAAPAVRQALGGAHIIGSHRTLTHDVSFGIDQLVEIAVRAVMIRALVALARIMTETTSDGVESVLTASERKT